MFDFEVWCSPVRNCHSMSYIAMAIESNQVRNFILIKNDPTFHIEGYFHRNISRVQMIGRFCIQLLTPNNQINQVALLNSITSTWFRALWSSVLYHSTMSRYFDIFALILPDRRSKPSPAEPTLFPAQIACSILLRPLQQLCPTWSPLQPLEHPAGACCGTQQQRCGTAGGSGGGKPAG